MSDLIVGSSNRLLKLTILTILVGAVSSSLSTDDACLADGGCVGTAPEDAIDEAEEMRVSLLQSPKVHGMRQKRESVEQHSVPICIFGQQLLITSHRGQQLEDRFGRVALHADKEAWQQWILSDAGSGTVFITSHRGQQLEDRFGRVALHADKDAWQQWILSDAGSGTVFITSHRGQQLEDRLGTVGLNPDKDGWQKWTVTTVSEGSNACQVSGSKIMSQPELFSTIINTTAYLPKFIGVGYNPDAHRKAANPKCDDFMGDWAEPLWGPSKRDDLQIIKDMGASAVRTYGIGAHINHTNFLNHAHKVGLKVMPGFADYPYLKLGSSCQTERTMPHVAHDCIRHNGHDCFDVIKANYEEMLIQGYTYVNETDGKRYYHPAVLTITVINECELKLMYNAGEGLGVNANHAKVVVTATDGILQAEKDLGIVGPKPMLTATVSYAACPHCKSTKKLFPGVEHNTPFLAFTADFFLAFQDPMQYVGYKQTNNLQEMYKTRWVNSFNTPRPSDSLCVNENKVLASYMAGPLRNIPLYIGEFHDSFLSPEDFGKDVKRMRQYVDNDVADDCGPEENALVGFNVFEFQTSYWKGSASEGGTGTRYGLWGLGWHHLGKTLQDEDSVGWETFDVACLCPAWTGGECASVGNEDTNIGRTIKALEGKWPDEWKMCS